MRSAFDHHLAALRPGDLGQLAERDSAILLTNSVSSEWQFFAGQRRRGAELLQAPPGVRLSWVQPLHAPNEVVLQSPTRDKLSKVAIYRISDFPPKPSEMDVYAMGVWARPRRVIFNLALAC